MKAEAQAPACGLWAASIQAQLTLHSLASQFQLLTHISFMVLRSSFIRSNFWANLSTWYPDHWSLRDPAGKPSFHMWQILQDLWKSMWELVLPNLCAARTQTQGTSAGGWCGHGRCLLRSALWGRERAGNWEERSAGQRSTLCKRRDNETKEFCKRGCMCVCACMCGWIMYTVPQLLLIGSGYLQGYCPLHMQIIESVFYYH